MEKDIGPIIGFAIMFGFFALLLPFWRRRGRNDEPTPVAPTPGTPGVWRSTIDYLRLTLSSRPGFWGKLIFILVMYFYGFGYFTRKLQVNGIDDLFTASGLAAFIIIPLLLSLLLWMWGGNGEMESGTKKGLIWTIIFSLTAFGTWAALVPDPPFFDERTGDPLRRVDPITNKTFDNDTTYSRDTGVALIDMPVGEAALEYKRQPWTKKVEKFVVDVADSHLDRKRLERKLEQKEAAELRKVQAPIEFRFGLVQVTYKGNPDPKSKDWEKAQWFPAPATNGPWQPEAINGTIAVKIPTGEVLLYTPKMLVKPLRHIDPGTKIRVMIATGPCPQMMAFCPDK